MTLVYANMKMSEAIESHLALVPVVNRFGIRLGVGDDTVKAVCDAHNVDPDFFLTIVNTFINEDYFPEKKLQNFHLSQIIDYLKKTNLYYLQNQLPNIERHLHFFLHASDNTSLRLLGDMFASFKEGLRRRIEADEREWFPLLLTPSDTKRRRRPRPKPTTDDDEAIQATLDDMRHIMLKHLSGAYDENLCYAVLFAIDTLGRDIRQHNRIRHRILLPMIDDESNSLSEREKDVLRLIVEGLTNKEIAARLYVSVNTVLTHRKNITAKLGIKTTPGLTFYAITHRLIPEVK